MNSYLKLKDHLDSSGEIIMASAAIHSGPSPSMLILTEFKLDGKTEYRLREVTEMTGDKYSMITLAQTMKAPSSTAVSKEEVFDTYNRMKAKGA